MGGEPTVTLEFTEDEAYLVSLALTHYWLDSPDGTNHLAYELAQQVDRTRMGKPQRGRDE